MASPPTSSLRFLDPAGRQRDAPPEWQPAWVEVLSPPERWETVEVRRNGLPLTVGARLLPGSHYPAIVAEWPRSDPGRYRLEVRVPGREAEVVETRVASSKIDEAAFDRLVDDLERRLPASIALGLQRCGAFQGLELRLPTEATRAQELTRLRRAVEGTETRPGLAAILREISADPHRMLHRTHTWARSDQARLPDPTRLAHALARPQHIGPDRRLQRVLDTRTVPTHDVYENRVLAAYAAEVERRLRALLRDAVRARSTDVAVESGRLLERLIRERRDARFLRAVRSESVLADRITMVLLKRPPYRAALQGYLELHRSPFVSLDDPALATPLINLPSLYQTWGTLQLVDAVLGVAADLGYELISQTLVHRAPGELYVRLIPNGSPVLCLRQRETGTRVDIIPERTYGHTGSLRSLTYEQRPDIAIEIRAPERSPQVLVLDPKYKLDSEWEGEIRGGARPVKTDLDKMHAYRDAIRDDSGRHVVRYAAILYPGDAVRYPPGEDLPQVEALRAYPGDETALRERLQTVLNAALT